MIYGEIEQGGSCMGRPYPRQKNRKAKQDEPSEFRLASRLASEYDQDNDRIFKK